jgi:hypothetical protein
MKEKDPAQILLSVSEHKENVSVEKIQHNARKPSTGNRHVN